MAVASSQGRRPLGLFCQQAFTETFDLPHAFPCSKARFLVPTHRSREASRAGAVKDGALAPPAKSADGIRR